MSYSSLPSTGDDACWEVDIATRSVRHWSALSVADAEYIAALVAATPAADVDAVVNGRQALADPPMGMGGGQVMARAWMLAPGLVSSWAGETLSLAQGSEVRVLSDACATVASPVAMRNGGQLIVVTRKDGRFEAIRVHDGQHRVHTLEMPATASLLSATVDGRVWCRLDANDGSWLYVAGRDASDVTSPLVLNRHLAEIRRPRAREVERTSSDGKRLTGVLMTPTSTPAGTRSPVILWAYPNSVPRLDGWLSRLNDDSAITYPFQYLLAQGFAVFQAPLPMLDRPDAAEPLDYVSGLILPWLGVLDQQPEVQAGQYGFWGHSDAGYVALALLATTDRFKAIAAASTFPDLAATLYSARLPFQTLDCAAHLIQTDRWYYEADTQRYRVGGSLWRNTERFVRNSALFRLEHATTPTLLMVGEYDAVPRSMEQVYSVLHGKGVPVELAYYWGEGHMISSPENLHDLWTRSEQFFRRNLWLS
ncbi:alpha/beta hydrolase family protein [Luteimonas saliphila]|uniref:alpha/beta hydrolase family protein n=1 Tax=Luteimonas saliphila TaxID=2804919 RepID=UPI00192D5C45|nr:prolyl oligopeptidase family serine peptidase [Luteimonas saliphila]